MFGLSELRNLRSPRHNSLPLVWSLTFFGDLRPSPTTKTKSIETLRHWLSLRVSAIVLVPTLLLALFAFISSVHSHHFDVFNLASLSVLFPSVWLHQLVAVKLFFVAIFAILSIHLVKGNEDATYDHIHHEKTRLFCFFLLTCVQIQLFKYLYLFIIF
jgi:succinate dehydrogenase hydrophobic anchor subunit